VNAYKRESEEYLGRFSIQSVPYDVMMYDGEVQETIECEIKPHLLHLNSQSIYLLQPSVKL
jgi:hypothetical protein